MKKIVPDPPLTRPFISIDPTLPGPEALVHLIQLAQGIEDTLDEYCCANAGEAGIGMLLNTAQTAQMVRLLGEHALSSDKTESPR